MQYKEDVDMFNVDKKNCGIVYGVREQAEAGKHLPDGAKVFDLGYEGPVME